MKKIFTLISALCAGASAFANVVFTDEAGTATYGDGQTMVINSVEYEGDYYLDAPKLKNLGEATDVKLVYTVDRLPEGTSMQDCLGGNCKLRSAVGEYTTPEVELGAEQTLSTAIEWNCYNGDYVAVADTCQVTFHIYEGETQTATVIVQYVHAGTSAIENVAAPVVADRIRLQNGKFAIVSNGKNYDLLGR